MEPLAFCRQIMSEYEEQWTEARGHQERHPLRVKMQALEALMARVGEGAEFERLVKEGCQGEDAALGLLCDDLWPRWQKASAR